MDHYCEMITGFHMEPGEDGDPIFCEKPAGMQIDGFWYCAEHFDEVEEYQRLHPTAQRLPPEYFDSLQIGVDIGVIEDETHVALFGIKDETIWQLDASKLTKTKF